MTHATPRRSGRGRLNRFGRGAVGPASGSRHIGVTSPDDCTLKYCPEDHWVAHGMQVSTIGDGARLARSEGLG